MPPLPRNMRKRRRTRVADSDPSADQRYVDDKSYKICSVLGGLDVTRFVSYNTRKFFEGVIEDVELMREFVSEAAVNGGIVGGLHTLTGLEDTLDWRARGFSQPTSTVEAGIGYADDRPDRRMERLVVPYADEPFVGDKQTEMAIVDTVSLILPWIVDRKSKEDSWWVDHQNGRSEGPTKEPFRSNMLYSAAWIGSYGNAWAYYPPFQRAFGQPFTLGDVVGDKYDSHQLAFVEPNFPWNNPSKRAFFRNPYPDLAQTGVSLISALAPIYLTGTFGNYTYNDTYIASTGLDITVASVSSLLDVLEDRMADRSFGILVDVDFNTIVISQSVVERIYPSRTGLEDGRITLDPTTGEIIGDRRNKTYLVSDTIYGDLTDLQNGNWSSLLEDVRELRPGERDFSTMNLTFTGERDPTEFYAMYERWKYVANWVLITFAPVFEVDNAINIGIFDETLTGTFLSLESERGHVLKGKAVLVNKGTFDVSITVKSVPTWLRLSQASHDFQTLGAGEILPIMFDIKTDELEYGVSSTLLTFNVQDDAYPDCYYNEPISLPVKVAVVCGRKSVMIGGRCVSFIVLLPAIIIPLILLYLYVEYKRKLSDSVWDVKTSELKFDKPPIIVGRGTFGLVLLAEYRGTQVAVKRVIPPKAPRNDDATGSNVSRAMQLIAEFGTSSLNDTLKRNNTASRSASTLFDFDNVHDNDNHNGNSNGTCHSSVTSLEDTRSDSLQVTTSLMTASKSVQRGGKSRWSLYNGPIGRRTKYQQLKDDFVDEMRHLSKLRHPCITTVMGAVISRGEEPLLVMEFMDQGSLFDLLHNESMVLEGYLVLPILRDIAQGVRFLHAATPQVIHGDLKAQNVLVDSKFRAKVADFGLSLKKHVGATGTPLWMAPELLRGESENTDTSDVYSFGIILYEVYSRKMPYHDMSNLKDVLRHVCDRKINLRPPIPESMPKDVAKLMTQSLAVDPTARPAINEIGSRLKEFDVENVEPGQVHFSMQARKYQKAAAMQERLLLDIFPKHVADALSHGRKVEPENFDAVTIFFSDIVGFTTISHSMTPRKVSDMLDRLYIKFDALSRQHCVFKVETIGDAWMGVTNICEDQPDHTKRIAEFSIDAIQAANETLIDEEDFSLGFVQIRVGFHSGPVLANVVGSRNPKYTIIGDTVNTSSRMESNSLPGRIQCSDVAAKLLQQQAPEMPIVHRGKISVKGKGEMDTYWVNEAGENNYAAAKPGAQSVVSEVTPLIRISR
mmetsp:Transcript_25785/g.76132  ORF Transcript_25785/g.76132 Transcript_25785/m.76132 type:complete len:1240 (-) Transcript_25785:267-3986(-)